MRRSGPAVRILCFLFALLFLQGCPTKPPPSGVRFPIASGSHTHLPATDLPILIWVDPPLIEIAVEWLQVHRYSNLLMPDTHPVRSPQIAHNFSTRKAALAVAQEMKAQMMLFLEQEASKDGTLLESDCGSRFNVNVDVRGVSTESGEIALRGNAHYPHCVDLNGKMLRGLACQAFATAWGFRPSGQLDIPSTLMCTAGQTDSIPVR
jgi:hypothetical protein